MSAGSFTTAKYEAAYNTVAAQVHPIRVQPETLEASIDSVTNDQTSANLTSPISAVISRGVRAKGLRPRTVTIQFPATGQPSGYKAGGTTVIPALTGEFYSAAIVGADVGFVRLENRKDAFGVGSIDSLKKHLRTPCIVADAGD